jgi:hypothetical protein
VVSRTIAIRKCGAWLIAAAIAISGCAPQQSAAPPSSAPLERPPVQLMQIKSELLDAQSQLGKTNDAMNLVAKPPREDLNRKVEALGTQYYKLQIKVNVARSRAYDLKSQATAYDAGPVGNAANEQMEATRFAFRRYMSTVEEIRGFLASDRSVAGVESVAGLIAKANGEAQELDTHITALTKAIDQLAATKDGRKSQATSTTS